MPPPVEATIRKAGTGDQGYICSTWLRSMMDGRISSRDDATRAIIDKVLDHHSTRVIVASSPTEPHKIRGWLCYSPLASYALVHYLYVRAPWRGQGIGRALMHYAYPHWPGAQVVYTHDGPDSKVLALRWKAMHMPISEVMP
jgi:Acetyltransferase (GNAT) family.